MLTSSQPPKTLPLTKVWEPQSFSPPKSKCAPPKGSCQKPVVPPCWHTLMPLSPASATYSILTLLWHLLGYSTSLGQASVGQVESLLPPSPPSPPRSQGWAGSAGFQLLCLPLLSLGAFQDQSLFLTTRLIWFFLEQLLSPFRPFDNTPEFVLPPSSHSPLSLTNHGNLELAINLSLSLG